ncbi:flavodoxin domain-containing protein [Ruminococcus sp. CLA-AA-H200]|uniref:Flavodoxin domain-containing protein n=1 Tax=Ruminococcus turbiniformis TaxID=2881258 RepID=A0ABS8FXY7_9FIRM|nr:flavodoxin domain-containing protein [Ruminococcus turbiniformis]MCC2254930.1 flavodoxin domain-containing protein [Ruminococcus turbiniformis]
MTGGIIFYQSKYGAAEKYAKWLSDKTGFDAVQTAKAVPDQIRDHEVIVLCGGIYASGIAGLAFLRKNQRLLKGKRTAVFCVGASPFDEKALNEVTAHNMKEGLKEIPVFYGRGAWDEEAMSFKDRTLCRILQKAVAKKDPAEYEPWERALMSAVGKKCDWTDPEYLEPLTNYVMEKDN